MEKTGNYMWKEHRIKEYQSVGIHMLWPSQEMMDGRGGGKKINIFREIVL
jgi:hypothetical protein